MSTLFISHSSKDGDAAADMLAWLKSIGYESVFLSSDPVDGIAAGSAWEQELYESLNHARAMIVLISNDWLQSRWCFAEVTLARMMGRAVFPVKIADCDAAEMFQETQAADLSIDRERGLLSLQQGLREKGLDPNDLFDWDGSRPPYPGFEAFQQRDAAIFFGREAEVTDGIATLNRLRRSHESRLLLVLGASGSGKSSLVRAGLLPRLWKDEESWLLVEPFRPAGSPIDNLAQAFASSFAALNVQRGWREFRADLLRSSEEETTDSNELIDLARDLLFEAKRKQATVLLVIDQFEELFTATDGADAGRFLRLLSTGLARQHTCLLAMATMRSDALDEFQTARAGHNLAYDVMTVDPMPVDRVPIIVEGPAKVGNVELTPGLVSTIERDTKGANALPLLAYTLRQLYERRSEQNRLELDHYVEIGGLAEAVRIKADDVIEDARPGEAELNSLRTAFIPWMVGLNAEGRFVRRRANRADLPPAALPLLDRFVEARLLVTGRDRGEENGDERETLEVAHEALLQTWPRLSGWLNGEDGQKLSQLQTFRNAAEAWHRAGEDDQLLVHRDKRLKDVEKLLEQPDFVLAEPSERGYLEACSQKWQGERRTRLLYTGAAAVLGCLALLAVAGWFWSGIQAQSDRTSRQMAFISKACTDNKQAELGIRFARAALLQATTLESERDAEDRLAYALIRHHENVRLEQRDGDVQSAEFSFDGNQVLIVSKEGPLRLWDLESGNKPFELEGHDNVVDKAIFGPKGDYIIGMSQDARVRLWRKVDDEWRPDGSLDGPSGYEIIGAQFSSNSQYVLTYANSSENTTLRRVSIWDLKKRTETSKREDPQIYPGRPAFNKSGDRFLTYPGGGTTVSVWKTGSTGDPIEALELGKIIRWAGFAPEGENIVTVTNDDSVVSIWSPKSDYERVELDQLERQIEDVKFSPDGRFIATLLSETSTVTLWSVDDQGRAEPIQLQHDGPGKINSFAFAPTSDDTAESYLVVTASSDQSARVWRVSWDGSEYKSEHLVKLEHQRKVKHAVFSPDGQRLLTVSEDDTTSDVTLWWIRQVEKDDPQELAGVVEKLNLAPVEAGDLDDRGLLASCEAQ